MASAGSAKATRHVLISGPPGIGKTTLIQKVYDILKKNNHNVFGFYTEEVRQDGKRIGFDIVTLEGQRGTLARTYSDSNGEIETKRMYKVGQYMVDVPSFEMTALPALRVQGDTPCIFIVDEVGKMELYSDDFKQIVRSLFDKSCTTILATIPIPKGKPIGLVEELRRRKDSTVMNISRANRDNLTTQVVDILTTSLKSKQDHSVQ